jgi:hypothetical protein
MDITMNRTPLKHELRLKNGIILRTIGDAAKFINKQDATLHWKTVGANIETANNSPNDAARIEIATRSILNALRTDDMLETEA